MRPSTINMSTSYDSIGRPPHAVHGYFLRNIIVILTSVVYHIHVQLGLLITYTINVTPTVSFLIMTMVLWYVLVGVTNTKR